MNERVKTLLKEHYRRQFSEDKKISKQEERESFFYPTILNLILGALILGATYEKALRNPSPPVLFRAQCSRDDLHTKGRHIDVIIENLNLDPYKYVAVLLGKEDDHTKIKNTIYIGSGRGKSLKTVEHHYNQRVRFDNNFYWVFVTAGGEGRWNPKDAKVLASAKILMPDCS